ncbi:MAG: AAA family ATPase [Clostridia bacterium]|nr:AAA family ATPase [Clostridia bacterium]
MIIESIRIDAFGCLSDFSCTLDPRLTIIEGENEAGKSTLAAFIRFMLYGFTGRVGGGELAEKKKRINWQKGRAAGSMVVRVGEKRYLIERNTTVVTGAKGKETYRESGSITDLATRIPFPGNEAAGERFLGVNETVFLNTAFVGQVSTRIGSSELNEAIENLLFSGDENLNVQRALKKIDDRRKTLAHKIGRGGEIAELERRRNELLVRLAAAEKENITLLEKEAELGSFKTKLATAVKKLDEATEREREEESALLLCSYNRMHEVEKQLSQAENALRNLDGLPAYRLHESDLTDLAIARKAAEDAGKRYREAVVRRGELSGTGLSRETTAYLEAAEKAGGTAALRAVAVREAKKKSLSFIVGTSSCALGLLLLLLALVAPSLFAGLVALPLIFGAAALADGVYFLFRALRARGAFNSLLGDYGAEDLTSFFNRMEKIDRGKETLTTYRVAAKEAYDTEMKLHSEYDRALSELDTVVHRFEKRLPEKGRTEFLDALVNDARQVMEKKKEKEAEIHTAQSVLDALTAELAGTNEAAARAALPTDREIKPEDVRLEEWKRQKEFYGNQQRTLSDKVRELTETVATLRSRTEDPAVLQAEIEELAACITAKREQYEACRMAYEAISGAGERLREQVSPRLSDFACAMMAEMTAGRYERVGVDRDLGVSMGTQDGTYALDYMSTGTQDLTYLSLRMALIDLLYREEKPPVCFDESFAFQDDARTERILRALYERSAEGQQNLIFTCHKRESEAAVRVAPEATVIRLSHPAQSDTV